MRLTAIIANNIKIIPKPSGKKKQIVILGSGWGSYSLLKSIDGDLFNVKVVTPRNHFLFTPLLCSTAVGTLEFRSVTDPIRNVGFKDPQDFILAYAEDLNLKEKQLTCRSVLNPNAQFILPYDKLIIGVGCLNNTFGIPGVEKHAHFLREIADAKKIRKTIISNCERALTPALRQEESKRLLHTVIVGGGPTGVEFGAELYDFKVKDVRRLYKHSEDLFKVTLVEADHILSNFDAKLRSYAERKMGERPNFTLLKTSVVEVKEDSVILKDGTVIPCGLVVWSTGLSPRKFIQRLTVPKTPKGRILTDKYMKVLGDPSGDVYGVGDCCSIESMPLPCTAQVAERQGRYLAKTLNGLEKASAAKEFQFRSSGMLAYIGDYKALVDLPEFKAQGFTSWLLWRSAYFTRLGSWRLRMQVPIDWLKTQLFGRDTSHF